MKRLYRNIRARDAAFQERPEVLKAVCVYAAIYVLSRVIHDLMCVVRCQSIVGHERITVEGSASGDMLAYFLLQYGLATARNDSSAHLAATLQYPHDGSFVLRARASDPTLALTKVHVSSFAADESFVHFHFAAELRPKEIILHRKANPLQHEP